MEFGPFTQIFTSIEPKVCIISRDNNTLEEQVKKFRNERLIVYSSNVKKWKKQRKENWQNFAIY